MKYVAFISASLFLAGPAWADGPKVHVEGGAAHAVGTPQGRELGSGGGGDARIELPFGMLGFQAGVGAVVLAQGKAPSDPGVEQRGTGSALFGMAGLRFHPFGDGFWVDANGGFADTGGLFRPAFDAHVGWTFRASSFLALGPYVGYTQIVQSKDDLRPNDARVLWAGVAFTFGSSNAPKAVVVPAVEPVPPPAPKPDEDGLVSANDACPAGLVETAERCAAPIVLVDDRIDIGDIIHFDFDSPKILPESEQLVDRIAKFIVRHPEIDSVEIAGHADAPGTEAYNKRLSFARARATRDMLVKFGVEESRLKVIGFGKTRMKIRTNNAEPENRRVEFIVTRHDRTLTSAVQGNSR